MSQENVERHHQAINAMNHRDLDAFLALMDDDVETVSRIVAVEGGLHGHDGIRQWWESWFSAFPDYNIEVFEIRGFGDVTIATLRALGHGAGSAVPLEDRIWQASRWVSGKTIWWRTFYTREEALEAVGLSEQDAHTDS
jgi:ketosteroid isomerase-like protein